MKQESIDERKARRKREAVQGVVFFALLQIASAVCFVSLCFIPGLPRWCQILFAALAAVCLGLIVPAVLLLKGRFQEIEGGELDAACEY